MHVFGIQGELISQKEVNGWRAYLFLFQSQACRLYHIMFLILPTQRKPGKVSKNIVLQQIIRSVSTEKPGETLL